MPDVFDTVEAKPGDVFDSLDVFDQIAPDQGTVKAAANALAQEARRGLGHALQGAAAVQETMPITPQGYGIPGFAWSSPESPEQRIQRERYGLLEQPAKLIKTIQQNPIYQSGSELVETAPKVFPVDPTRQKEFIPKAAGMVGSFLPLVASGPAAPATIGLQSVGAHIDEDWTAAKAEGASDDVAAQRALNRGLASGGLQAGIFFALPAPLRKAGEKYLVEKFGTSAVKEFMAGRVALGAEGAMLGATSTMAENVVSDRPLTQGVGAGAAGLGAMNLLLPPYMRSSGRNRVADTIEGELGGGASVPASSGPPQGVIPPERQLRAPAIELPGPGGMRNQTVLQSIAELDALLRDLPEPPRVERLPASVTDAGLNEVLPVDATTDIRQPPIDLTKGGVENGTQETQKRTGLLSQPPESASQVESQATPGKGVEAGMTSEAKPTEFTARDSSVRDIPQSSASPRLGGEPVAETPAAAVAKVQEHVTEVASGEKAVKVENGGSKIAERQPPSSTLNPQSSSTQSGPRPAKEIKSELVQRLEAEIAKLPPEPELLYSDPKKVSGKREFYVFSPDKSQRVRVRESTGLGWTIETEKLNGKTGATERKVIASASGDIRAATRAAESAMQKLLFGDKKPVTIRIPGDGSFTIERTHAALNEVLRRSEALTTSAGQKPRVLPTAQSENPAGFKRFTEEEWADPNIVPTLEQLLAQSPESSKGQRGLFEKALRQARAMHGVADPGILDKAQAAVEGRIDEIKRERRLRAFGDPELAMLRTAQGAIYILKGAKNFAEWSAQMIKRFGDEIKPHLDDLWEQAKLVATGQHPTIGLSEHGVKTIANEDLSASVRDALNVHYAKLTDESAKIIASARIAEAGGPMPASVKYNAGGFANEPGKVENAIAAGIMRSLSLQEKAARNSGKNSLADSIADAQVAVAQRSIDKSPDAGQTLQSFKLFYEQFSPAAWLMKFKRDVGSVAAKRTEAAIGRPVEPSPVGVAKGIADAVGEQTAKQNPKLGKIIQEEFGTGRAGTPATAESGAQGTSRPTTESLATRLERTGQAAKGKGQQMADKISKFYQEEVAKFRRLHGIPEFDAATQRDILNRAKAIDAMPVDSVQRREASLELLNHLRRLKGFQWWELPLDFWYANILSGPTTHLKNISGNAASLGAEVGLQIMRSPQSLPSILEALGRALPRSATEAANIMRTGHDTAARHGGKFETHGALDAVGGTAGKILLPWKLVGRALKAADVMFFYPLQEVKGAQLASRESGLPVFGGRRAADVRRVMGWTEQAWQKAADQAKAEGLAGNLAQRRTYELLEQARPETLMDNARDFAFQGTFNNDPYGVLGAVQRGFERTAREVPALKLIAPFTRIITNITNSGMNWTPVGAWRAARAQGLKLLIGRDANTGKLYGKQLTDPTAVGDAYARATLGTLALGGLAMAAGQYVFERDPQFMVTGSGPADPDQKKQLREAGWIPYSIKIGNRYYTYQDKTWAAPVAIVGHYMDAVRYRKLDQQDALNRAAFALSSSANVIVQSSWLQGLSAIFDQAGRDSVQNPLKALPQQAIRTAASFVVPNALRQVDQLFDPTKYKADDIRGMMLAQLPFARRNNQPDLNVFGEPVDAPLSKGFMSKLEGDGLTLMLAGRRLWPSVPLDPYLTPGQSYALLKYRGPQLRAELLANYADIATLPHAEAQKLVGLISRRVTVNAKKDLGFDTLSGIEKQATKMGEQ